jgi:hypothetical protein
MVRTLGCEELILLKMVVDEGGTLAFLVVE